ncbi:hypothetical protein ACFO9Q_02145 [Paenibacillus sp. GCM10023252]|uniref:hypothetical protein n=1 Tax=Paenibacillus sp. GCM10023252 TaxID=3252649 RepID=UPI00360CE85E
MAFSSEIKHIQTSDVNEKSGLYQYVVTTVDQSKYRLFLTKDPDWKLKDVNRLLNFPCPVCRKDYYCKCANKHMPELEAEFIKQMS